MNSITTWIGIDPGLDGAIAFLFDGDLDISDTPTVDITVGKKKKRMLDMSEISDMFVGVGEGYSAYIEDVWSSPQMGVASAFSMGFGLGVWHMVITSSEIPLHRIRPQEWKREFGLIGKDKGDSIRVAKELFPKADITLKKHHGRAEALLIAEYGRRQSTGRR